MVYNGWHGDHRKQQKGRMSEIIDVRPFTEARFEEAVYLVERFFAEEGFFATTSQIRQGRAFLSDGIWKARQEVNWQR